MRIPLAVESVDSKPLHAREVADWSGWENVKYLFSFGDSYTTTGFSPSGTQPNAGNPFGNPAYWGYTSSNGPNWIDYLTVSYNESQVFTYNLAYGGATVDSSLVAPYQSTVLDLTEQVEEEFLVYYSGSDSLVSWTASNSLFSIWIGINDVGSSYYLQNATLYPAIFKVYAQVVEELYDAGARNFLFLNVPPVDRAPQTSAYGTSAQESEASAIADFNERITAMALNLSSEHSDVTAIVYDTNALFTEVLDDPSSHTETAGYKNTTAYCSAYQDGTSETDTYYASCGIPVDEYFWLNSLHPTFPMHKCLAAELETALTEI